MVLFQDFTTSQTPAADAVDICALKAGSGPPLLLLHGFPQTQQMWHAVAPALVSEYTVVTMDLRGYGQSSKPAASASHAAYAKSAMAADCVAVMQALGFESFFVCAHDRGARVAHALCRRHPDAVRKVMLLDICPTQAMYAATNKTFATIYWHWFFLIQKAPFPENMINANPRQFLEYCTKGPAGFHPEAWAEYEKGMNDPECVTAMCEDYRAAATIDLEEAAEDERAGRRIHCPLRVLWGTRGVIELMFQGVEEWRKVHATGEVSGEAVECGHFIPEQKAEVVLQQIREFLVEDQESVQ